jgi:hypothetical protein
VIKVHGVEFEPAQCLRCGDAVWHWPKLVKPDGRPVDLDVNMVGANMMVAIHECEYDEREDGGQPDDPQPGSRRLPHVPRGS